MPSRSSPPKSGLPVSREHAALLLEDGARIESPPDALIAAAEHLRGCGLIDFRVSEYVLCVEPRDADFPPRNRNCAGRITLEDGQDEDGNEIRCPACDRAVRPYALNKRRQRVVQTSRSQPGVLSWVRARLEEVASAVTDVDGGAFRAEGFGALGVLMCVVDADGPASRANSARFAATNHVCYVTMNSQVSDGRFLPDKWVCRLSLADLVSGSVDLRQVLTDLAAAPQPTSISTADPQVYAKGHVPVITEVKPKARRLFVVELGDNVVRVNGEVVVNTQAKPRLALFKLLWEQFVTDLSKGTPAADFTAFSVKKLMTAMKAAGHVYGDEGSLRKLINNLQSDIETAVKRKLGTPISREDVVETCRMEGQSDASGGYRLNPVSVAIRPFRAT